MRGRPHVVYFSSTTENTHRFVQKLDVDNERIPVRRGDQLLAVNEPYVLVVPTYGGGAPKNAVPKQVIRFLNNPENRALCRGVISAGNTNFGQGYCIAGNIISAKLKVPFLYKFELLGTQKDVQVVREGLVQLWQKI